MALHMSNEAKGEPLAFARGLGKLGRNKYCSTSRGREVYLRVAVRCR